MGKKYRVSVKIMVDAVFNDNGHDDLKQQAADAVSDGEFQDLQIMDIYEPEEA